MLIGGRRAPVVGAVSHGPDDDRSDRRAGRRGRRRSDTCGAAAATTRSVSMMSRASRRQFHTRCFARLAAAFRGSTGIANNRREEHGNRQGRRSSRALLGVSDKTGLVDLARALEPSRRRDCSRPAAPRPRSKRAASGQGGRGLHRLSRDSRRPRQDAASENPRRNPRATRRSVASAADGASTASSRSTWSW